jgi:hypothetical protein
MKTTQVAFGISAMQLLNHADRRRLQLHHESTVLMERDRGVGGALTVIDHPVWQLMAEVTVKRLLQGGEF